jgi:hypothetical protein
VNSADLLPSAVEAQLTQEERLQAVVYIDDALRPAGAGQAGDHKITVAAPYWLVFIDRAPGANWMHAARYLVINSVTRDIASLESNRPPSFGRLPAGWRVLWRSAGIEDWRLMPIAPPLPD